jgi:nicotinate-nucleotide adenylyltransferase
MKIGIFGGSFDPIHNGHLALAKSSIEQVPLDKLIVVPAKMQPFKMDQEVTSGEHRVNMLKLAFRDFPQAEISRYELEKTGISYTTDTLDYYQSMYPLDTLYFVMGTDAFLRILDWKNSEKMLRRYVFAIGGRPGYRKDDLIKVTDKVKELYNTKLVFLNNDLVKQASTQIRDLAENRINLSTNVPKEVADYIVSEKLYINQDIREYIQHKYTEKRRKHTFQVEETAVKLGQVYGVDVDKIRTASLFHDLCRGMEQDKLNAYVKSFGLDDKYLNKPNLSHGKVGAKLMARDFGVTDQEILDAVSYHTTGRKGMNGLEKIIYLADAIEPDRDYPGVEKLRSIAFEGLDQAVLLSLEQSISFVHKKGYDLDNDTVEAKNDISDIIDKLREDLNGK